MAQEGTYITIPALGRHALLGYLYDERTDQFRGVNVFKGPVTGNAITTTQTTKTSLKMALVDTNRDKFRLYDIKASIQANLLSGMLQITGSAAYLQEEKKSAREVKGIMLYECPTAVENLQLYFEDLKDQYNTDVVNQKGATHIVTQIKWGGNVAIEFSKKVDEEKDEQKIKGSLEIVFEKAKGAFSIKASAEVDLNLKDQEKSTEFSLNIKGDILLPDQTPTTPEEVQFLIKQVPQLIQKINDGKGVPLEFTLTPIGHLRTHLKQTSRENEFAQQLDESILNDFINISETISEVAQQLYDYTSDFRAYPICVPPTVRAEISHLQSQFTNAKLKFQGQMKETIIAVRTGTAQQEALAKIAEKYQADEFSPTKVQSRLQNFDQTIRKIELYKTICKSFPNVQYFGYKSNLDTALLGNIQNVIYALFLFPKSPENDAQTHQENEHLFFHKLNHPFNKLFVVDCDFEFAQSPILKRTVIQQIVNNKINIEDVNEVVKRQKDSLPFGMKALGRFAKIGQLYDIRTDTFLRDNFLTTDIPESAIQVNQKSGHTEIYDIPSENIKEKFKSLKVEPELQYSILADMISLHRSGLYLNRSEESQILIREDCNLVRSFVHSRRLAEESISVTNSLLKYFAADAVSKGATHFVTKVDYGFVSIFQTEELINENDPIIGNTNDLQLKLKSYVEQLKRVLKRIQIPSSGNANASHSKIAESDLLAPDLDENFRIKVYSDIQGEGFPPETIESNEDLLLFLNNTFIPKQMTKNSGKGMPIAYILYPLSNLGNEVGVLSPYIPYEKISQHFPNPNQLIDILEEISLARNQIQKVSSILDKNTDCVTDKDFTLFREIREDFNSRFGKAEEFKNLILSIKSGKQEVDKFENLLTEYKNLKIFDNKHRYIKLQCEAMNLVKEKIQIWNEFKKDKIVCIGRATSKNSLNKIFSDKISMTSKLYLFFYHPSWTKSHGDLWRQNSATFLNLADKNDNVLCIVNCEFEHEFCKTVKEPTIHEYTNGILTSGNFIATQEEILETTLNEEASLQLQPLQVLELRDRLDSNTSTIQSIERKLGEHVSYTNRLELKIDESWRRFGSAEWVSSDDGIPWNAVPADFEEMCEYYVARAHWEGNVIPGKLDRRDGLCYFTWKGEEKSVKNYEILVAPPATLRWNPPSRFFTFSVVVGGVTATGEKLFIGRCRHGTNYVLGKVDLMSKTCYISLEGSEIQYNEFEILCKKSERKSEKAEIHTSCVIS